MTSFYSEEELKTIGLKSYGKNVSISRNANIYSPEKITIGNNVRIDDFCIISGNVTVGNNVHIAAYTAVFGGEKGVTLDDFVGLSSRVIVYASCDDYSGETLTNPTIPMEYKNVYNAPVYIGKHVLVGAMSIVMPGVVLEEGSSFGCYSYINRDSEGWSLNVGIPFRKIRDRSKKLLELEKEYVQSRKE